MLKLLLAAVLALLLLFAAGFGAYKGFQSWQGHRLVRRAEAYLASGDLRSAALSAHRAFQLNHENAGACRVLARIAEITGQPAALEWRKSAVLAAPDSIEDKIALANAALQFERPEVAKSTLAGLGPEAQRLPAFQEAEAKLAFSQKDLLGAEKYFTEAAKLDPANKGYQFNLAAVQLQSGSQETRAAADQSLRRFLEDKEFRILAARALRDDAARRKDGPDFLEFAGSLAKYPEATFRDRIAYAQALHVLNHPDFAGQLSALQKEAESDPNKLAELVSWMSSSQLTLLAVQWIKGLPNDIVQKRPVPIAVADCYLAMKDWKELQTWCSKTDWGELEFFRHAYLSRALREQDDKLSADSEWAMALHAAESSGDKLYALAQGAGRWNWKKEAEDLLWKLAKDRDKQSLALATLHQYYLDKGDTADLYRVVARLCELKADDDGARNNLAQLSLLLNIDTERAYESAERLYQKSPQNPVFISTYAFSLYRRGRFQQAAKVMGEIKPEELEKPAYAGYYGILLAGAGEKTKAAQYLQRANEAPVLPEERALLDSAQSKINQ